MAAVAPGVHRCARCRVRRCGHESTTYHLLIIATTPHHDGGVFVLGFGKMHRPCGCIFCPRQRKFTKMPQAPVGARSDFGITCYTN